MFLFESNILNEISRELSGFTKAVTMFPSSERAALNATITYPVVPSYATADIIPAATGPAPADTVVGNDSMTISKSKGVTFYWSGDEQLSLGDGYDRTFQKQVTQAMRPLTNEVEGDLAALAVGASRAVGVVGTTPFSTDLSDAAGLRQILADNGAPLEDLSLVVNTASGTSLRSLSQLTDSNRAATDEALRRGLLLDILGFQTRESGQITSHTKGTGTSYLSNNAGGYAIGATSIAIDTGTGTVLAGDAVTFTGDSNKYLVTTGVSAPGTIVIAEPGLRAALSNNVAMKIGGSYSPNVGFARSAIHLATRIPAVPSGGDSADDVIIVEDPLKRPCLRGEPVSAI